VSVLPLLLLFAAATPPTSMVSGTVVDAWTLTPIAGVALYDPDQRRLGLSDETGSFSVQIVRHTPRLRALPAGDSHTPVWVNVPRDAHGAPLAAPLRVELLPRAPTGPPAVGAVGVPRPRAPSPALDPEADAIPLRPPLFHALPAQLPTTIKVLRCPGTSCCTAPGDGVETLPVDEYVKGVVYGEIGVFANMSTQDGVELSETERQAGSAEVFKTFAVSARSYALWWYLQRQGDNPGYDIRDGSCEQVYSDGRLDWVDAAAMATTGQVFADSSSTEINKYEYASSCLRLGTLPYGMSASDPDCADLIPDATGTVACVGSWCGHDTEDMGHQTHPCDPGGCRCLVRGICQWGAAERSYLGQSYVSIVAHYQPNLSIVDLSGGNPITGRLVGYVRAVDLQDSEAGISGAHVSFSTGASVQTDDRGFYELDGLQAGQTVTLTASALGFISGSVDRFLDPAQSTWWRSIALQPVIGDAGLAADASAGLDSTTAPDRAQAMDGATASDSARPEAGGAERGGGIYDAGAAGDTAGVERIRGGCACSGPSFTMNVSPLLALICLPFALWRRR